MPFNTQGIFTRLFKWRDDRDNGINILAERMDQETDSIVSGINQIVQGEVNFTGTLKSVFGTAENPSFTFYEDTNTGVYRIGTDSLGISTGGEKRIEVSNSGTTIVGNLTVNWQNANVGAGSNLDADRLDGKEGVFYQNAENINSGTLAAGRLSGTYEDVVAGDANKLNNQAAEFYQNAENINAGTLASERLSGSYENATSGNANKLNNRSASFYQDASNIVAGELSAGRLSGTYDIDISGELVGADNRLGGVAKVTENMNLETANGWFVCSSGVGRPSGSGPFIFENLFFSNSDGRQRGFFLLLGGRGNYHGNEYERFKRNGLWGSWRRVYTRFSPPQNYVPNVSHVRLDDAVSLLIPGFSSSRWPTGYGEVEIVGLRTRISTNSYYSKVKVDLSLQLGGSIRCGIFLKRRRVSNSSQYSIRPSGGEFRVLKYFHSYNSLQRFRSVSLTEVDEVTTAAEYEYSVWLCGNSGRVYANANFNGNVNQIGTSSLTLMEV